MLELRANISEELMNAINDRIYLDLELHVLNNRLFKAEREGKEGFAEYLNKLILDVSLKRKATNECLRSNGVKIHDVIEDEDAEFVTYPYHQKINGGFKEGEMRYWRSALKLGLKKRMSEYFKEGEHH